jgi:group II intron reverse transcriptase/maturase
MAAKPPEKAMYVAPRSDSDWLRSEQRKLYTRSEKDLDYVFRKLWGLVTDLRNLRVAFARVTSNRGARTSGVDGMTVRKVLKLGADVFLSELRAELRSGQYKPSPVRRVQIPKPGQPGKFRPLGIPTVKDRVVQAAMKSILEPIFEADFYPVSYGFRPGKSAHGALAHLRLLLRPNELRAKDEVRLPYQWALEGDIKGCFDHIDHHALMEQVRLRVQDPKVNRLVVAFLKAGVLVQLEYQSTDEGTPQGGILSPLLANIALGVIESRYARHVWPRRIPAGRVNSRTPLGRAETARNYDRRHGRMVLFPIRYADDCAPRRRGKEALMAA